MRALPHAFPLASSPPRGKTPQPSLQHLQGWGQPVLGRMKGKLRHAAVSPGTWINPLSPASSSPAGPGPCAHSLHRSQVWAGRTRLRPRAQLSRPDPAKPPVPVWYLLPRRWPRWHPCAPAPGSGSQAGLCRRVGVSGLRRRLLGGCERRGASKNPLGDFLPARSLLGGWLPGEGAGTGWGQKGATPGCRDKPGSEGAGSPGHLTWC